jgi:hypothetical protein
MYLTFSCNNVVESVIPRKLFLNKGMNNFFGTMWENESRKGVFTPGYLGDIVDVELG